MKLFNSKNSRIREERDNVFEAMSQEENHQRELTRLLEMEDKREDEITKLKADYNSSVKRWKELNEHYNTYDAMLVSKLRVSPDAILTVAGSVAQIVFILNYEKIGIVTSKAVNYITKKRV